MPFQVYLQYEMNFMLGAWILSYFVIDTENMLV